VVEWGGQDLSLVEVQELRLELNGGSQDLSLVEGA